MTINTTWTQQATDLILQSDYGFFATIIPFILILGISFALSRKIRDMLYIQFPLTLTLKFIFPFIPPHLIILSLALVIINLIGSKGDILSDVKNVAIKTAQTTKAAEQATRQALRDAIAKERYDQLKQRVNKK